MPGKRAVIYARFSSSAQREESIEGQIRDCKNYADKNGYTIVSVYADRAKTGRTDNRPEFQRMIKDSDKKMFDIVLCYKHDRFARNRYDASRYRFRLKNNNVTIEYSAETVPEGADGIIVDAILEGYAEYYSANLAENVKRGMYESATKLQTCGMTVLGYTKGEDGRFAIDPPKAEIVKRIYTEYAAGKPSIEICRELNAEGFRTSTGGLFNRSSIANIIKNEKYKGVYDFFGVRDENGIPRIVDNDLWEESNALMKTHAQRPRMRRTEDQYLLAGKLFCGECESEMTSAGGFSASGKYYRYYACKNKECHKKNVPKEILEDCVADMGAHRRILPKSRVSASDPSKCTSNGIKISTRLMPIPYTVFPKCWDVLSAKFRKKQVKKSLVYANSSKRSSHLFKQSIIFLIESLKFLSYS